MTIKCDFDGWVTKNDILCTDGRIISKDAFKENDGKKVPLVFQHSHTDPSNVLGNVILENRPDGVYGYATFNNTTKAQDAKECVRHGDLNCLSIFANGLRQSGNRVIHGSIKEVSLVLAGANSGAKIQNLYFEHADGTMETTDQEAIILPNIPIDFKEDSIIHEDKKENEETTEETLGDVLETLTEKQKKIMLFLITKALAKSNKEEVKHDNMEENTLSFNKFEDCDDTNKTSGVLSHSDEMDIRNTILSALSPKNKNRSGIGSLGSFIQHAVGEYGIDNIDWLFPDAKLLQDRPEFINKDDAWVATFIGRTKHLPMSRVRTIYADITGEEARAKGYTKGNRKVEEVITLLRRSLAPTTIYKKQAFNRDDLLDINSFDVIVWIKGEMRIKMNEETARAGLFGDGRLGSSNDKIDETKIVPVWTDDPLFSIPVRVEVKNTSTWDQKAEKILESIVRARKRYRGSGDLTWYISEDVLADILLMKDGIGNRIYKDVSDVMKFVRVNRIVSVPIMENLTRTVTVDGGGTETRNLIGIILDEKDYSFGTDRGGELSFFDDFDIDFNQFKYLMETRASGGLTKPFSAMVVETVTVSG